MVEASTSSGLTAPLDVTDNAVMSSSRVCSPTSISNLIEMALGPQNEQQSDGNKDGAETPSFAGRSLFEIMFYCCLIFYI